MIFSPKKLDLLRASMIDQKIDLFIIPSTDPHLGEYIPDYWRIIAWLTGFTGSFATVVVTDTFAGLWTDSRYFIQAENQLHDSGFVLINTLFTHLKDFTDWLHENVKPESKIGFDRIRSLLREKCLSPMGLEKVDNIRFIDDYDQLSRILSATYEFQQILIFEVQFPS